MGLYTSDSSRILLIQIRDQEAILAEELRSVAQRAGIDASRIDRLNVIRDQISTDVLTDMKAVIIGGAGAYSVTQTYPWTDDLIALCHECANRKLPTFGSCWGHQFLGRAFGGTVIYDPDRSEIGTCEVTLTDDGRNDDLFGTFPDRMHVQMGHHDRVSVLPKGAIELATTDVAPFQAFRMASLPIYGTQFHSELDRDAYVGRLEAYRSFYPEIADDEVYDTISRSLRPTPIADTLIRTFLERFVTA